ncbi:MAG: MBL fold metallo-hydrolase [Bacteroidales bacterium]|nr:MBL fold metallo-hydrolase [Bacteroidales bacterium]
MLTIKYFVFNPICVNTFVIYNESKECVIVDPGNHNIKEDNILFDYIEKNQLKPIMILNTHGHIDHILGNYSTAKKYGIPLASHPDGEMYYKTAFSYAAAFGIDYKKEETLYPTIELFNNQIINIGEDELEVIFTPGHAKGSCCFYCEKQDFVITGDTLFRRGIGRTDLPGGSYKEIVESLENELFQLPDETICYCGHGPETTIGEERFH